MSLSRGRQKPSRMARAVLKRTREGGAERARRFRARKQAAELNAAGKELPQHLQGLRKFRAGKPRLPWDKLRPNSQRKRLTRDAAAAVLAALAEQPGAEQPVAEQPAAEQIAEQIVAKDEADAAAAAAEAARRLLKLANSLDSRNASDGVDATGAKGNQRNDTVDLGAGASGLCHVCWEDTRTFTPCCGTVESPTWLCAPCVTEYRAKYATVSLVRGPEEWHTASHLRSLCPVWRCKDAFANGSRALRRAL